MKTLVIIQARIGGTRFPGKVAMQLAGMSVLEHAVRRARHKGYTVAIASPSSSAEGLAWSADFRRNVPDNKGRPGFVPIYFADTDENDVLGRVAHTARWASDMLRFTGGEGYGCVVRLTADCPFLPVSAIDAVAEAVTSGQNDYCETRSDPSSRPNGIDAQAVTMELLQEASAKCVYPEGREHLTSALLGLAEKPGRVQQLEGMRLDDLPGFRLTLDTPDDLVRYQAMAAHLSVDPTAGRPTLMELRDLHRRMPELFCVETYTPDGPFGMPMTQTFYGDNRYGGGT